MGNNEASREDFQNFMEPFEGFKKDIISKENVKISQVSYENVDCFLKQYKGKDVSEVYEYLKSIRHKNIAEVYDAIFYQGDTYIIEEKIPGESLEKWLKREKFTEDKVIDIAKQLCDALQCLHSQNPPIIHRDIKPANIIYWKKIAVLVDFDIVRQYKGTVDNDTRFLGTARYCAPEQYGYGETSPRSDIYSLGVTMHELLTGVAPRSKDEVTYQGKLREIICRCMEMDPKNRFQSADDLRKALEAEGLIEQSGMENGDDVDLSYLNIAEKRKLEISKECASLYFKGADKRKENNYCESASYVIFTENEQIVYVHKETAVKNILLDKCIDIDKIFSKKRITAFQDMAFFVIGSDVFYYDLENKKGGFVFSIPESANDDGSIIPIENIALADKKFIYGQDWIYVYDLELGETKEAIDEEGGRLGSKRNYILIGEYIYFLSDYSSGYDFKLGKRVCKYGLKSEFGSIVSKPFSVNDALKRQSEPFYFFATEKYIGVVMEYFLTSSIERNGFECVYVDITKEESEIYPFYIWSNCIYQINSYMTYLTYINASKKYSIVSHDFVNDKKKKLVSKYGSTEKASLQDKLFLGKEYFQHPNQYMIMGKWIWYREKEFEERIVSICWND